MYVTVNCLINPYDNMQQVQSGPFDDAVETACTDKGTYWSPSSKEEGIYAQMSCHKYQETPRDKVKMLTKLGEGEFGEVYKAVLKTPMHRDKPRCGSEGGEEGSSSGGETEAAAGGGHLGAVQTQPHSSSCGSGHY